MCKGMNLPTMRITSIAIADRPSPLGNTRALRVAMPVNSMPIKMQGIIGIRTNSWRGNLSMLMLLI